MVGITSCLRSNKFLAIQIEYLTQPLSLKVKARYTLKSGVAITTLAV